MRVLVTGGAGFIASHVIDRLIAADHNVACVDDLSTGQTINVNPKADFFKADVRDTPQMAKIFDTWRPEMVSHHAAQVNLRKAVDEPLHDASINVLGTVNLLKLGVDRKIRKFVFVSSGGAVYGDPERLPVDESHPTRPLSPYGASKLCGECYVLLYNRTSKLDYAILRYSNVYGPRQNPKGEAGVMAIFSMQMLAGEQPTIFGDGTKTRDYVYVEDVAEANLAVLTQPNSQGCFNLGTGVETSDFEVFAAVRDAVGIKMEPRYTDFRPGEVYKTCLDCSLARTKLGWEAKTPFAEGAKKTVAYYRALMKGA
jgi:UDP-glucose 4-epimerase